MLSLSAQTGDALFRITKEGKRVQQFSIGPSERRTTMFLVLVFCLTGCGLIVRQAMIAYIEVDSKISPRHVTIEINRPFIEKYQNRVGIHTTFTIDKAMPSPYPPPLDGDLHFAGRAPQVALPIVAEIANAKDEKEAVGVVNRAAGTGRALRVSGVWRIWPEHAGHAKEQQGKPLPAFDADNPAHVFEIHPATRIHGLSLLRTFKTVSGFVPGDAERTFGIFQKVPCTLSVRPTTVSIVTETGVYNDVEFV